MKRNASVQTSEQKISDQQTSPRPPILTIPEYLFAIMASYMDAESQFALAHTCKTLYEYHKNQCKEQTFTLLCNTECKDNRIYKYVKAFETPYGPNWLGNCESHLRNSFDKCSEQL